MKKLLSSLLALTLVLSLAFAFTGCWSGGDDAASTVEIAVPNDMTNEARALLLLQDNGLITLKDGAGITATVQDITDNPHNIKFQEVEAAQLPSILQDVDYAVINSNYALDADLNPVKDALPPLLTATSSRSKRVTNRPTRPRRWLPRSKARRLRTSSPANMMARLSAP